MPRQNPGSTGIPSFSIASVRYWGRPH